ncbi:MFS transporter [Campylobacter troglodytis]|nr:MFS transporter [Campylobacter troglodytis]
MMRAVNFEDLPLNKTHLRIGFSGIGGQFCDGFILGIIGITMILAQRSLDLDSWWLGAIGAASLLGLFFGSLIFGFIADKIGRKPIFVCTMPLFALISVAQFFVGSAFELFILRLILGLVLGADYVVGISLVNELTPKKYRGRLLSAMMIGWVGGYALAYVVGYGMQNLGDEAWRYILLSSALPSFVVALFRFNCPSSPYFLIKQGKIQEAKEVLERYFGANVILPEKEEEQKSSRYFDLFSSKWLKNTLVGIVFYGAQVIPYFAISTFIPIILKVLNVEDPYLGGIVYNIFLFIGSVLGFYIITKISRRLFLVGSFYALALIMIILASFTGTLPSFAVIILISLFSCILAGAGVLEFAYTPELFPTALRASGVGLVIACSRISGALGTFFLPVITESFSIELALWVVFATVLFAGIFCQIFAPETQRGSN